MDKRFLHLSPKFGFVIQMQYICIRITANVLFMEATITRRPTSFRLRNDLIERLKRNAARENRTLNNYVESVLLDVLYKEPKKASR